jgi:TPR repeat protein
MSVNGAKSPAFRDDIGIAKLAFEAVEAKNYPEALRLLEPLIERDSEYALMTLGWMHENAKGVPSNMKLAESLYQRATEIGCLEAYNCLGLVLRKEGEFVRARNAYMEGAKLGNLGSMTWLGAMMVWEQGGPKDIENGKLWLTAAAEAGHFYAKALLLTLERENSRSIFRHCNFYFKRILLGLRSGKEYYVDPYSEKIF